LKQRAIAAFFNVPLQVIGVSPEAGFPRDWLTLAGLDRPALLLVRPDGHVLAHVEGSDEEALAKAIGMLSQLCGKVVGRKAIGLEVSTPDAQSLTPSARGLR
jgi:hypothetical protein